MAAPVVLSDLNASVTVDPESQSGMYDWTVNGSNQLSQQWFWYRIGAGGPESSLDTLATPSVIASNSNLNPGDDSLVAQYAGTGLTITLQLSLTGTSGTAGRSDITETIALTNTSSSAMDLHFFEYADFDLGGLADGDSVWFVDGHSVWQQKSGGIAISETVQTPVSSHREAAFWNSTLSSLTDGSPTILSDTPMNTPVGPGDVTWTYQWDLTIAPGDTALISKDKSLVVPEPSSLAALVVVGGIGLLRRRRLADA